MTAYLDNSKPATGDADLTGLSELRRCRPEVAFCGCDFQDEEAYGPMKTSAMPILSQ